MKRYYVALFFCLLSALGYALYLWNMPHRNYAKEEPTVYLHAHELANEFAAGGDIQLLKYTDQILAISGFISAVGSSDSTAWVAPNLYCQFDGPTNLLQVGDSIQLKGQLLAYDDLFEEIKINHCTLLH